VSNCVNVDTDEVIFKNAYRNRLKGSSSVTGNRARPMPLPTPSPQATSVVTGASDQGDGVRIQGVDRSRQLGLIRSARVMA